MKKFMCLGIVLLTFFGCSSKNKGPKKVYEDGVEIVINQQEPSILQNEKDGFLQTEEELIIDLEDKAVLELGLHKMDSFGVDTDGNIYIMSIQEKENQIFKFSASGDFIKSFGRYGQGPGELGHPSYLTITSAAVLVSDPMNTKLVYYDTDGELVKEIRTDLNIPLIHPLKNSCFVVFGRMHPDPEAKTLEYPVELCDEKFQLLKTLDVYRMENSRLTRRISGVPFGAGLCLSEDLIFTADETSGYEIRVHNVDGNLVRKIRKDYKRIPVSGEFKKQALEKMDQRVREYVYFPENFPPFQTIFASSDGHLFVLTYKRDDKSGEFFIDVFNPDGIFIHRLSADILLNSRTPINAVVKNKRLYYIREKENGFCQFVVEKILFN
jgi:hypothetical protein